MIELNKIYNEDVREVLKTFPDKSINCCITSPPYWGLRDYGTATWVGGDPKCNHVRDNKIGDKCQTGQKALKYIGIGDSIYKNMCKKCGAIRKDQQIGLEETPEEYIVKLLDVFREVKRVLTDDGTLWVNLGDTYSGSGNGSNDYRDIQIKNYRKQNIYKGQKAGKTSIPNKSLCCIPDRFKIATVEQGWICRNEIIWHKDNAMPESVKDRFTVDFEKVFFFTKSNKYYFNQLFEPYQSKPHSSQFGTKSNDTHVQFIEKTSADRFYGKQGRNKRSVWSINTKPFSEAHFAVFPEELVKNMVLAGCPKDGIVLDPFMGAGTVGLVAVKHDRNYVGIELNQNYINIANKRIKKYTDQYKLFNNMATT